MSDSAPGTVSPSFHALAASMMELQQQGVGLYTPIVNSLLAEKCRDLGRIEGTLDGLLDFARHPDGIQLYRRLCRHLWVIDPALAANYAQSYRAWWDPDDERPWAQKSSGRSEKPDCESSI